MTTIRRAASDDADAIARVWYEAWGDGHTGHVPDGLMAHRRPDHVARRAAAAAPAPVRAAVTFGRPPAT